MKKVIFKKEAFQKLLKLCKDYSPRIVCGFLVGKSTDDKYFIEEVREVKTKTGKRIHFQPVFTDFRRVSKEIHKDGKEIVGEFHTHPDGNPEPTFRDRTIMKWLKFGFWIIATEKEINPFTFEAEEFKTNIQKLPYEIV